MTAKPGILFTDPVGFTGGAELRLLSILDCLDRYKVVPVVVCGTGDQLPKLLKERGVTHYVRTIRPRSMLNYLGNTLFLLKIIRRHNIKLIHGNAITSSIASAAAAKISGTPFIADIRDMIEYSFPKRMLINFADIILVHSEAVKKWMLERGFPEDKLRRVYMGIWGWWFEQAQPVSDIKSDYPIIGFIGQIAEIKGVPILLRALQQVARQFPRFNAVLVGKDFSQGGRYLEKMKELAEELEIGDRVNFIGFVDNPQNWIASFDIVVIPSMMEPLGMAAAEALAQKKPVIVTRTGGLPEIVENEVTGLVVEPGSVDELSETILRLLQNPQYAKSLGEAGYHSAKARFHIDNMMREMNEVYKDLIGFDVMQHSYLS
ncbi:MAG: glycosyltransferase family 4 protein [candidate division Zixibacteria bacterium]|nr:glycosyltransferase family 4 protein [Candidatus Tariuqbacter arcticus]